MKAAKPSNTVAAVVAPRCDGISRLLSLVTVHQTMIAPRADEIHGNVDKRRSPWSP